MCKWDIVFQRIGILFWIAAAFLSFYNVKEDNDAKNNSVALLQTLYEDLPKMKPAVSTQTKILDDTFNPQMDMPTKFVGDKAYIGVLEIPELSLSLPIMEDWSYPDLKISPCRYYGSAYQDNMVLMAHNYQSHFGKLKTLFLGAWIIFTDVDGNIFTYQVASIEIYNPLQVEEMISGEWDLKLFTCTIGGKSRITICCERIS